MRLFNDWQLLLNTALATRLSELEMKPLPAFNFEDITNLIGLKNSDKSRL